MPAIGERLGRNARFASIGNGIAAAAMGACGYFFSGRAVFFVTAVLLVPTLIALAHDRPSEIDPERAHGGSPSSRRAAAARRFAHLLKQRPLLIFSPAASAVPLANAAMLPLMGSVADDALEPTGPRC